MKLGSTRAVFRIGRHVIKVPRLLPWRNFLQGLLGNMQEAEFRTLGYPELCPILFAAPGGFLVVMKYARPMTRDEFVQRDMKAFIEQNTIPAEMKPDSFGWLDGEIVAIDYGS